MRISYAYLVVVDISGYTRFITERSLTLSHAEQIISDLINAVLDRARHPLILNKLEGDAALLYREIDRDDVAGARDVLAQVRSFFPAFHARVAELRAIRSNCNCDACSNITALNLKALVHVGEVAIKQVRQFDELAGEPVILLHRLMKNTVPSREYVLLTQPATQHAQLEETNLRAHSEEVDGMGVYRLWIADPRSLPETRRPTVTASGKQPRLMRSNVYQHLPTASGGFGVTAMNGLRRWWLARRK